MAGGPSPSSTSPPDTSSPFIAGSYSSSASSPPSHLSSGANLLSASAFGGAAGSLSGAYNCTSISPINERKPADNTAGSMLGFGSKLETSKSNPEMDSNPAILIRKLPRSNGVEALRSMLLFAKDLIDVGFVSTEYPEDPSFASAIARFRTLAGAHEAKDRLHGKTNAAGDAAMLVDVYQHGTLGAFGGRRNTMDMTAMRQGTSGKENMSTTNGNGNRQSSRFNGTFQALERRSPPSANEPFPPNDLRNIQGIFSPKSPAAYQTAPNRDSYISSKAMINDDAEDETGKILANPVEFAINGETNQNHLPTARRQTQQNSSSLVPGLGNLSLNTKNSVGAVASPPMNSFPSSRATSNHVQSPASGISPHTIPHSHHSFTSLSNTGSNGSYSSGPASGSGSGPYGSRHQYPPVNPADQNPPCNTLYVGNLPLDTSEDELKAMFSKQRGYKRLSFRTKQNGPMCFVEFEDVSFATKALNELYGQPLHNSIKGGIRLSFSKNPLGVRTGQTGPNGSLSGSGLGMSNIPAPPGFNTVTGPPPGLSAPPGLASSMSSGSGMAGSSFSGGWGSPVNSFGGPTMRTHSISSSMGTSGSGGSFPSMGGEYAYMMGR